MLSCLAAAVVMVPLHGAGQPYASSSPSPSPPPPDRLLTPEQEGRQGVVKGVAEQPLRDFNLVRSKIPPVLQEAMADPYARPSPASCGGIATQIQRLDEALGPDLDHPISTEHPGLLTRGGEVARNAGLDVMRGGVQDYIPFDGFIRVLSGASRHDHLVMAAIQAGAIRRGYLKGLGEMRSCPPPGVPLHLAHPIHVAEDAGR
jgi:hypothetical protein